MDYTKISDLVNVVKFYKRIGIDGIDGCGKTDLSTKIGGRLNLPVLNLDDFLKCNTGSYVESLKYDEIKESIEEDGRGNGFIIEGVCLFDVLEKLNLELDCIIYVKTMNNREEWLDQEECEFSGSEKDLGGATGAQYKGLGQLRKEVMLYHARQKPYSKASHIFKKIRSS